MSTPLAAVRRLIPPLKPERYKGQAGRIGILGGSEEYSGAPYFAGISALKAGADLCHVFCAKSAGIVIKSYSPELIVHPCLSTERPQSTSAIETGSEASQAAAKVSALFGRLHVLVVGPGLSRDRVMLDTAKEVILAARRHNLPLIIDADGLFLVQEDPSVIHQYRRAVLTPNANEFKRLCEKHDIDVDHDGTAAQKLSKALGNVTIVQKGAVDVITDGLNVLKCDIGGSNRRCGGQGDLLAGSLATFLGWSTHFPADNASEASPQLSACYGACVLTRQCSAAAFQRKGRSMMTTDMIEEIGSVFGQLFPDS
ncbi:Ribokinase-like protein [Polychytrium aggregatum]|uniref:Ribokinase-like protein n=1 Tax=Polychytrium aggregatum TaxID=110093 RepID=UPI0022FE1B6D|nr:Ribokinase-like protein [Polychytrium aggregatum]KAI9209598.1 Ribokinase-like protein [Polychytrium aggregatum]